MRCFMRVHSFGIARCALSIVIFLLRFKYSWQHPSLGGLKLTERMSDWSLSLPTTIIYDSACLAPAEVLRR